VDYYASEFAKIIRHYNDMRLFGKKAVEARAMHSVDANSMIADGKNRLARVIEEISAMSKERTKRSHGLIEDVEETFDTVVWASVGFSLLALVIAVLLVIRIPGALVSGIRHMTEQVERLGAGDYSQAVKRVGIGELDELAAGLENIRLGALKKRHKS